MQRLLLLIFVILLSSCSDDSNSVRRWTKNVFGSAKELNAGDMQNFVVNMDNGLLKSKTIDEVTYSVKYKPIDYVIATEMESSKLTAEVYKQKYQELSGMQYFDLRIEIDKANGELLKYGLHSAREYEARINYLAFEIKNNIELIDGNDTLPCVMHHFERVYDIVPYATVLLGFKQVSTDLMHEKTIVYHDKLFGKGIIKFTFLPADLQLIPKLEVIS